LRPAAARKGWMGSMSTLHVTSHGNIDLNSNIAPGDSRFTVLFGS
jgi:hypothetical protein